MNFFRSIKKNILLGSALFCLIFQFLVFSQSESDKEFSHPSVDMEYRALHPGEVIKVTLDESAAVKMAMVRFLGTKYSMGRGKNLSKLMAFVGIDLAVQPGAYKMTVSLLYKDGSRKQIEKEITVLAKQFPVKKLWVKEIFVTPPPEAQERIKWESNLLETVYGIYTPQWLGDGEFIVPSEGRAKQNFGEKRIYNDKPRSSHSGIDISSPFGAPVRASNSGKVVLASDLYFSGKTVIVDHGLGVFSYYCHLSSISLKIGDLVSRGSVIGNIGATGRVTGPHLHWGVKASGCRVDPFSLLSLGLKETGK